VEPIGQVTPDGQLYWDGKTWLSTLSPNGKWRWNGHAWIASSNPMRPGWSRLRIGSWVAGGLSVLLVGFCALTFAASIAEAARGDRSAGSSFGVGLVMLSLAVALASPLGIRWAMRRGLVVASSIAAALLFLGSCGGGFALVAAYPLPSPSPEVASRIAPTPSPGSPSVIATTTSAIPSDSPSPSAFPSPSPSPSVSPSPSAAPQVAHSPSPTAAPKPSPKPAPKPPPVVNFCGAPSNPWGYNFCGRGGLIHNPATSFCSYFAPCVSTFWTATNGYVVQCVSGKWSHSGGVSGACSSNGGVARSLYSGP